MMMTVEVRLYSILRPYAPAGESPARLEVAGRATVSSVLEALAVPPSVDRVILVNGHHATEETPLAEGDAVTLFPPVTGG